VPVESILQVVGSWLATIHAGYAIFLVLGCVFAVHAAALVAAVQATRRRRWVDSGLRWLVLPIEVLYGLLNPLVYLIVLVHVFPGPGGALLPAKHPWWMLVPAWLLLAALWGARVLGRRPEQDGELPRRAARVVLGAAFVIVAAYLVKDSAPIVAVVAASSVEPPDLGRESATLWLLRIAYGSVIAASWLSLYLVPLLLLRAHLRATATPAAWAADRRFLLGAIPGVRPAALALVALAMISVLASVRWSSEASVRALVLERHEPIVAAARRQGIDPRLLAALVYVVQRDAVSPLSLGMERVLMGAWLGDLRDNFGLATALDASIGLTQIKPTTAIHAARIQLTATANESVWQLWSKELRPLRVVEPQWTLPAQSFAGIAMPFDLPLDKPQIVAQLFTDHGSLAGAAFILALYEAQWRSVYPHLDLATSPEITATLYQIGFARSQPHAAPRANAFGAEVGRVFRSEWIEEHFGTPATTP